MYPCNPYTHSNIIVTDFRWPNVNPGSVGLNQTHQQTPISSVEHNDRRTFLIDEALINKIW